MEALYEVRLEFWAVTGSRVDYWGNASETVRAISSRDAERQACAAIERQAGRELRFEIESVGPAAAD